MTAEELLITEKNLFIEAMNMSDKELSLKNEDDYYVALGKAFDDAFNQYARRKREKYATKKGKLMEDVLKRIFSYFKNKEDSFELCFSECIKLSKKIFDNRSYGMAQKFVNMSFKYLYCFSDVEEFECKFEKCHMPLDKYTIKWVRNLKCKDVNKGLSKIDNAWSKIDEKLYNSIQELINKTLKNDCRYKVSYCEGITDEEKNVILPSNQLQAEFIVWHQEKINELRGILNKVEKDWNRLGIKQI